MCVCVCVCVCLSLCVCVCVSVCVSLQGSKGSLNCKHHEPHDEGSSIKSMLYKLLVNLRSGVFMLQIDDAARSQLQQGLKINYGKSSFGVFGQSEQWKLHAASYLNCRIMPLPFSYLGIPIEANPEEVKWDYWLMEQEPLREKYPRLYNISCQQQKLIQDMGCQSANVWEWKLEWRRHLFEWRSQFLCNLSKFNAASLGCIKSHYRSITTSNRWEVTKTMGGSGALFGEGHCFDNEIDTAGVFLNEVQDMAIQQHGPDVWEWTADPTGQYTTNNAYKVIMGGATAITQEECFVKLWSIKVPRKIAIFARRLIRNRLPTRQRTVRMMQFSFFGPSLGTLRKASQNILITGAVVLDKLFCTKWSSNLADAFSKRCSTYVLKSGVVAVTLEVKGLGRGIKWASIRRLVGKHKIDLLCLQETKRDSLDKALCQTLWGQSDFEWEWVPAVNTAGGLLCIWNNNNFQVEVKTAERRFIMLEGVWLAEMQRVVVANIYAPCEIESKRQLWEKLYSRKSQSQIQSWCLVGDFNCIRHPAERLGSRHSNSEANLIAKFNDWLAEMEIDDIPCVGKPFTWVRPNGSCKSKLDRVLVSDDWLSKWPDSSQFNLERNYSDHCPILMNSKCTDWGPKPFRVFDAWLSNKDYTKNLKHRLKTWSRDNCGDLGNKVKQTQKKLNDLEDSLTAHPSEQQIQQLKKTQSDLWEQSFLHESIVRQKSRNKPAVVKAAILQHFQARFAEPSLNRPNLDGVSFNVLSNNQREMMPAVISKITEMEIRDKQEVAEMGKRQSGKNILILWDALKQIKQQDPDCIWCFMGDFNNIRHHSEREGISPRGAEASIINDFNEWIAFSTGLAWDFFWRATPETTNTTYAKAQTYNEDMKLTSNTTATMPARLYLRNRPSTKGRTTSFDRTTQVDEAYLSRSSMQWRTIAFDVYSAMEKRARKGSHKRRKRERLG
ncbi:hypothetical protein HKD37_12G034013 [Glycine soja]